MSSVRGPRTWQICLYYYCYTIILSSFIILVVSSLPFLFRLQFSSSLLIQPALYLVINIIFQMNSIHNFPVQEFTLRRSCYKSKWRTLSHILFFTCNRYLTQYTHAYINCPDHWGVEAERSEKHMKCQGSY